jgi:hypothetical protein
MIVIKRKERKGAIGDWRVEIKALIPNPLSVRSLP